MPITSLCDSITVSEGPARKVGLNRQTNALTAGGEGTVSHTLPNLMIGNGRSTRHSRWVI